MYKIVLPALMCLACHSPALFDCSDSVITESESPDGRYSATFFERDCGATTDYTSLVSLRESRRDFDAENADLVVVVEGRYHIEMQWTSRRSLLIDPGDGEIFRHEDSWRDVRISVKRP